MRKLTIALFCAVKLGCVGISQAPLEPRYAAAEPMPLDRAEDSYTIYSMLLSNGPIEWRDARRSQWLIESTTRSGPLAAPCSTDGPDAAMNPHHAVSAPSERKPEWAEVMEDFDRHCHDAVNLESDRFQVALPVHLLDEAARGRYLHEQGVLNKEMARNRDQSTPGGGNAEAAGPREFPDAAGLQWFTEVYFNPHHTLALVEQGIRCAGTCGNWSWVVLERKDGVWRRLPWVRYSGIS